ncbi:hypothetical protein [Janthinobacterium agaricidamnosum]|uniref:Uncharacterized protein n=1 Tax=Janthinobacterium agaricidamnosum NBRC 102515 = DSM 9628 TaxID=1349767 RepID=W0V7M0_9BURK|nr:hypothetical protein [Janthinobacterium agaricidamnosum]CDG83343.1 hypothetical protein GJA_2712 [Janthinobacterium agaricidamnosum NBRC 102515 = DSM 9628]
MEKIREQTLPGLWSSEWWNIGHGYTVLVKTRSLRSTMQVMAAAGPADAQAHALQPPHWPASQPVDVTERIADLALFKGEADLVDSGLTLTNDSVKRQHLECPAENVALVLQRLEKVVAVLQIPRLLTLPEDYRTLGGKTRFDFTGIGVTAGAGRDRKKEGSS